MDSLKLFFKTKLKTFSFTSQSHFLCLYFLLEKGIFWWEKLILVFSIEYIRNGIDTIGLTKVFSSALVCRLCRRSSVYSVLSDLSVLLCDKRWWKWSMNLEECLFELFFKLALCLITILTFTLGLIVYTLFALAQLYAEHFFSFEASESQTST